MCNHQCGERQNSVPHNIVWKEDCFLCGRGNHFLHGRGNHFLCGIGNHWGIISWCFNSAVTCLMLEQCYLMYSACFRVFLYEAVVGISALIWSDWKVIQIVFLIRCAQRKVARYMCDECCIILWYTFVVLNLSKTCFFKNNHKNHTRLLHFQNQSECK